MATTWGILAAGQLTNSEADLYTVPSDKYAFVRIVYANTSTSTAYTVNLKLQKNGGTARNVIGASTAVAASADLTHPTNRPSVTLGEGDKIRGYASVTTVIDYTIEGVEFDT